MDSWLVISFLNELELICLLTSIAIVSIQLNGFKYFYQTLIILSNINHLFATTEVVTSIAIKHCSFICSLSNSSKYCNVIPIIKFKLTIQEFQVLLCIINNSIKHRSLVYTNFFNHISSMHQSRSSVMHCLHHRFRVFLHHIGSDRNPGMTLEEPSCLLDHDVLRSCLYPSKKINKAGLRPFL